MEAVVRSRVEPSPSPAPDAPRLATYRKIAILVGLLFILQMVAFAFGSALIDSFFSGDASGDGTLTSGVLLEIFAGLAVAVIGVAMFFVLRPYGRRLALAYPVLRIMEALAVIAVGAYFLSTQVPWTDYHLLIYAFTAPGGLVLSYMLLRSKLVPRWLSLLGLVGYGALLLGTVSDALGIAEIDSGAGFLFFVPGGLFEIVFLPIVLIFRGFNRDARSTEKKLASSELVGVPGPVPIS